MRRGCISLIVALCLTFSATAFGFDEITYYVGAEVGGSIAIMDIDAQNAGSYSDDDTDENLLLSAKVGLEYGKWRGDLMWTQRNEMEYGFGPRQGVIDDFEVNANLRTLLVSGYYDFVTLDDLAFFVGGGVGVSFTRVDGTDGYLSADKSGRDFAWQLGVGCDYDLDEQMTIEAGYRYVDLGDEEYDLSIAGWPGVDAGDFKADFASHDLYVGFRYRF
jgi:opacity protein-like surface antigen